MIKRNPRKTALSKYFEQEVRNQSTLREGNTSATQHLRRELPPGSAQLLRMISKAKLFSRGKRFRNTASQTRIASRLSLAHSVTPRLKTVHRTVFPGETAFLQSAHSSPPFSNSIKKEGPKTEPSFFGGEGGTRTPAPVFRPTYALSRGASSPT